MSCKAPELEPVLCLGEIELQGLSCSLTVEQLDARTVELRSQVRQLLTGQTVTVSGFLFALDMSCDLCPRSSLTRTVPVQLAEVSGRLSELRAGAKLVSPAERAAMEKAFADAVRHWAKRRRIFRGVWCLPPCEAVAQL